MLTKTPYIEEKDCSLSELIDRVSTENKLNNEDVHIGRDIWEYISALVLKKDSKRGIMRITDSDRDALLDILTSINQILDSTTDLSDNLSLCQEAAIAIGNRLDEILGENSSTVGLLESFCEDLYQISINEDISMEKASRDLKVKLLDIKKSINNIPKKYTAVFLPYKYSMWDSMESIYKASEQDERFESMVIAIPYFEKDRDGSFGQVHYEGAVYKDIPIKYFGDIDLESQKPDTIFIHNPYDEYNYVTSIHPDYYCSKICEYTDMLVYVPYYISIDDWDAPDSVKTCGVLYSNKVINQAESTRALFADIYEKWVVEELGRPDLKGTSIKKFEAFASCKIDKLFSYDISYDDLPEVWQKRIKLPDGGRKKIILFYNGIGHVIGDLGETFLKKVDSIFECFRNREDVILWWRPHPLTVTTISNINPAIKDRYLAFEKELDEADWGILDYSDDMYPALILSDGAYGFAGSVSEMYKYTGKPRVNMDVFS